MTGILTAFFAFLATLRFVAFFFVAAFFRAGAPADFFVLPRVAAAFFLAHPAGAQSPTGTILGTVKDSQGAAVPGATLLPEADVGTFAATAERLADEGKSPLYAAIGGRLAAIIAVADPIKETTPEAIRARRFVRASLATGSRHGEIAPS